MFYNLGGEYMNVDCNILADFLNYKNFHKKMLEEKCHKQNNVWP